MYTIPHYICTIDSRTVTIKRDKSIVLILDNNDCFKAFILFFEGKQSDMYVGRRRINPWDVKKD